jgi:hypothetical protein
VRQFAPCPPNQPLQVACSHFYFTWEQALQLIDLFDAEMAISERLRASEMMYSRCTNPLLFWEEALPTLPTLQVCVCVRVWSILLSVGRL